MCDVAAVSGLIREAVPDAEMTGNVRACAHVSLWSLSSVSSSSLSLSLSLSVSLCLCLALPPSLSLFLCVSLSFCLSVSLSVSLSLSLWPLLSHTPLPRLVPS
jgi:hypothetical protein